MKFFKAFFIIFFFLGINLLLTGCNFPLIKKKKAALKIDCHPKATIFLNDNHIGQTPFSDENLKPGEYNLKLVPETQGQSLFNWQGIIRLNPGLMTVVRRDLAATEEESSGYVLSLDPITEKDKIKIAVISSPDGAVVNLDGEPKGFAPVVVNDVLEGDRLLTVSSSGFKKEKIPVKAIKGYKLIINVQLAKEQTVQKEESEEASKSAQLKTLLENKKTASEAAEMEKPYVKIKNTPTGWLNVRSEPSTSAKEETILVKIHPEEVYKFIEANETGWYKIEYEEGKQGWISGKYATLVK